MGGELVKAVIEKIPSWVFSVIGIGIVGLFFMFHIYCPRGLVRYPACWIRKIILKKCRNRLENLRMKMNI